MQSLLKRFAGAVQGAAIEVDTHEKAIVDGFRMLLGTDDIAIALIDKATDIEHNAFHVLAV